MGGNDADRKANSQCDRRSGALGTHRVGAAGSHPPRRGDYEECERRVSESRWDDDRVHPLGAARAGALLYSQMVFTAILAWLILGEAIEWYHYAGGGLVVVGIILVTFLKHKAPAAAA